MKARVDWVLVLLLALSVGGNIYQARRTVDAGGRAFVPLASGDKVPPLVATSMFGKQVRFDYTSANTVVYVFSPACVWCERNLDNINEIVRTVGVDHFVPVSLVETGLEEYVRSHKLGWAVVSKLAPETLRAYKFSGTPQTLVIGEGGKVIRSWSGAYVGPVASDIESFYKIRLPGLRSATAPG